MISRSFDDSEFENDKSISSSRMKIELIMSSESKHDRKTQLNVNLLNLSSCRHTKFDDFEITIVRIRLHMRTNHCIFLMSNNIQKKIEIREQTHDFKRIENIVVICVFLTNRAIVIKHVEHWSLVRWFLSVESWMRWCYQYSTEAKDNENFNLRKFQIVRKIVTIK